MREEAGRANRSILAPSPLSPAEFRGFGSWTGLHHTRSGGNRRGSAVSKREKDHPAGVRRAQRKSFKLDLKEDRRGQKIQNLLNNAQAQRPPEIPSHQNDCMTLCPGSQVAAIQKCEEKPAVRMSWACPQLQHCLSPAPRGNQAPPRPPSLSPQSKGDLKRFKADE